MPEIDVKKLSCVIKFQRILQTAKGPSSLIVRSLLYHGSVNRPPRWLSGSDIYLVTQAIREGALKGECVSHGGVSFRWWLEP